MNLANESVDTAIRVLGKFSAEMEPAGAWRWKCVVQNGTRLPLGASLEEGFLHLAGRPETNRRSARALEHAVRGNDRLEGGVKFALNGASRGLHLRAEIALLNEAQLLARLHRALAGFHQGFRRMKSLDSCDEALAEPAASASAMNLGELLREASWPCAEHGPNDFSADLNVDSPAPARITANERGVMFNLELVRCNPAADATRLALATFLLTASSALRLVRAHAVEEEGQQRFGFQVCLPPVPAPEEIDHALAALSIAYRLCGREANVLLDDAAARCYLAVRDVQFNTNPEKEKEK
jgi:hypothetical protein